MILIPDEYLETESAVYKLYYGEKYVIVKGKTLAGSVYLIEKGYGGFIAGGGGTGNKAGGAGQNEWDGTNAYYFKFYTYIYNNPGLQFNVLVLLESNNAYQLLKREQQELNKSFTDKSCLNNNVQAYLPKFNKKTWQYGWVKMAHVMNFKKFLKA